MNKRTHLNADAKAVAPACSDAMPHTDILKIYVGLLCLGKSDFEAVNSVREGDYFAESLGLSMVPSKGTLRQRMDAHAAAFLPVVQEAALEFLRRTEARITPLDIGLVALDANVTPFDNSQTRKKGVSRTYKGMDGYAPMAAYLGQKGYCLELELREGKQHCQKGTPKFLARALERVRTLTDCSLLLRLDGGNDAIENIDVVLEHNEHHPEAFPVHYLIKWNPRKADPERWLAYAEEHSAWSEPRPGKFATNALVLAGAQLAYNILRRIGQNGPWTRRFAAPQGQAAADPHCDAGADVPGGPAHPPRAAAQACVRSWLSGGADVPPAVSAIGLTRSPPPRRSGFEGSGLQHKPEQYTYSADLLAHGLVIIMKDELK